MTTWQAIISTATQSPKALSRLASAPHSGVTEREAKPKTAFVPILGPITGQIFAVWKWLERRRTQQLTARRLRVAETVSLGEKCFVSILQVDGAQFLVGRSAGNISLLTILNQDKSSGTNEIIAIEEPGS